MPRFRLYRSIADALPRVSYVGKLSLVAFVGVHVPLLLTLVYVAVTSTGWEATGPLLVALLTATLAGTAVTLGALVALTRPISAVADALDAYAADGTLPMLPATYTDEVGRLMAQTQATLVQIDNLLAFRDRLLGVLSHDGRNAVSSVRLALGMLQDEIDDASSAGELADLADRSAAHLEDLLGDLLDVARHSRHEMSVEATPVDLSVLVREVDAEVRPRAEAKGVALSVALPQDVPPVHADAVKLRQAMANLAHNAVKFTEAGGRVTLSAGPHGANEARISVEDTGIGMDPTKAATLFEPFSEERRRGTDGEPGTGLGLWIVKTFTEMHGGHVRLHSAVGEGTRITLTIPREPAPEPVPLTLA
ncbi:MAG: HAMP domain-containing sensor histidine kinase [Bacteroidota bacterium]